MEERIEGPTGQTYHRIGESLVVFVIVRLCGFGSNSPLKY